MFEEVFQYFNIFLIEERKDIGDISQVGVYIVGNNMYLLLKYDILIFLNSKGKKNLFIFRLFKFILIFLWVCL